MARVAGRGWTGRAREISDLPARLAFGAALPRRMRPTLAARALAVVH
jgi:hypothetical protein